MCKMPVHEHKHANDGQLWEQIHVHKRIWSIFWLLNGNCQNVKLLSAQQSFDGVCVYISETF